MKPNILLSGFLFAALSTTAPAALIAQYFVGTGSAPASATDYHDNLQTPSKIGISTGSGLVRDGEVFTGWGTSIDTSKYVGFTIAPQAGYEMHLTQLSFQTGGSEPGFLNFPYADSFQWGYRIDLNNDGLYTGAGEGWVMGQVNNDSDPNYTVVSTAKTWDINVNTTGTVEFALFGSAPTPQGYINNRGATVFGEIVPEPSSVLLVSLTGLAALRRRRH